MNKLVRKEMFGKIGIYKLFSNINNRLYIGSSSNLYVRLSNHFERLNKIEHTNIILQNHFNKYGKDSINFEIIEYCNIEDLIVREQFWMDYYQSYDGGFNIRKIAESCQGLKRSEETKLKMSLAHKGRVVSDETKEKISKANKGKPSKIKGTKLNPKHVEKVRQANLGKKRSPEICKMISEQKLGKKLGIEHVNSKIIYQYDKNWNYIREWYGAGEIMRELNIQQVNITKVCRGERNFAGGFIWSYEIIK